MNVGPYSLGVIIAVAVGILALVLAIIGQLPWLLAGFFIALAIARLT